MTCYSTTWLIFKVHWIAPCESLQPPPASLFIAKIWPSIFSSRRIYSDATRKYVRRIIKKTEILSNGFAGKSHPYVIVSFIDLHSIFVSSSISELFSPRSPSERVISWLPPFHKDHSWSSLCRPQKVRLGRSCQKLSQLLLDSHRPLIRFQKFVSIAFWDLWQVEWNEVTESWSYITKIPELNWHKMSVRCSAQRLKQVFITSWINLLTF